MPLLHLDSSTRVNTNEGSGAPEWQLASAIRLTKLRLLHLSLPHSFYTIPASSGISVQVSGSAVTPISVAVGIRSFAEVGAAVQAGLRASGLTGASNFTCTANVNTLKLSFTHNAAITLVITAAAMARLTGIPIGSHSSTNNTITPTDPCEIAPTHVTITSKSIGNSTPFYPNVRNSNIKSPLFVIPLDQEAGSVVTYNEHSYYTQVVDLGSSKEFAQISLELRNPQGDLINPGLDWTIILEYMN